MFMLVGLILIFSSFMDFNIELGKPQTDFEINKIYKTLDDGLLYLEHNCSNNHLCLELLVGESPDNLEEYAQVRWFGTITLPIEESKYWLVRYNMKDYHDYVIGLKIIWNPIIGCIKNN